MHLYLLMFVGLSVLVNGLQLNAMQRYQKQKPTRLSVRSTIMPKYQQRVYETNSIESKLLPAKELEKKSRFFDKFKKINPHIVANGAASALCAFGVAKGWVPLGYEPIIGFQGLFAGLNTLCMLDADHQASQKAPQPHAIGILNSVMQQEVSQDALKEYKQTLEKERQEIEKILDGESFTLGLMATVNAFMATTGFMFGGLDYFLDKDFYNAAIGTGIGIFNGSNSVKFLKDSITHAGEEQKMSDQIAHTKFVEKIIQEKLEAGRPEEQIRKKLEQEIK
jgi:hypothetical protein